MNGITIKFMQKRENGCSAQPSVFLLFFLETHFDFSFPQKKPFDFFRGKNLLILFERYLLDLFFVEKYR